MKHFVFETRLLEQHFLFTTRLVVKYFVIGTFCIWDKTISELTRTGEHALLSLYFTTCILPIKNHSNGQTLFQLRWIKSLPMMDFKFYNWRVMLKYTYRMPLERDTSQGRNGDLPCVPPRTSLWFKICSAIFSLSRNMYSASMNS